MNQQANNFGSEAERVREAMAMKMDIFAAQVRKLSELHDEGLLTEEEFSAKKAELLREL
jgi:putative oligomerization/nucleic acid binding protein